MTIADPAHHDPAALDRLRKFGGDKLLRDMVGIFSGESARRLKDARDAVQRGDGGDVANAAHALKSSSAQLGAVHLSSLCAQAEQAGTLGDMARATDLVQGMDDGVLAWKSWIAGILPAEQP